MKKKVLSIILALVMVAGMVPFGAITAFAEETYPIVLSSGYEKIADKTYDLSGKTVSHVFELSGNGNYYFSNVTFMNVTGEDGCCVYIDLDDGLTSVDFYNCRFINCSTTGDGIVYVNNITNSSNGSVSFHDCTIENCKADDGFGGFIYVTDGDARPVFNRTVFDNCSAEKGGVVYINSSNKVTEFNDCLIKNCHASEKGGVVYTDDAEASVKCSGTDICGCYAEDGGAFYMNNGDSFIFENGCTIFGCHAEDYGGAIYINDADGMIRGNGIHEEELIPENESSALVISGCTAEYGGGVYLSRGERVEDVVLADNTATYNGGGMYNYTMADTDCTIFNCYFIHNKAGDNGDNKRHGGGLYVNDLTGHVQSCTFFENTAYDSGADLYSNSHILYCTFTSLFDYDDSTKDIHEYDEYYSVILPQSSYNFDSATNGSGTQSDPYRINSVKDWNTLYFMTQCGMITADTYIRLDSDITVTMSVGTNADGKRFKGKFDGNNHTVKVVRGGNDAGVGAFGAAENAEIKNLNVTGYIYGDNAVGGVVGNASSCIIRNCTVNAEIYACGHNTGGIAGIAVNTTVSNCTVGAVRITSNTAGGIVGNMGGGTVIDNCISFAKVEGYSRAGGIVGSVSGENAVIRNCVKCGTVTGNKYAGGIVGYEDFAAKVYNAHSFGTVSAFSDAYGISGCSASESVYELCLYNKDDSPADENGIGVSRDALYGKKTETVGGKEFRMPNYVNDYINENKKAEAGWLRMAFDDKGDPIFVQNDTETEIKTVFYIGSDGTTHYKNDPRIVDESTEILGEIDRDSVYVVTRDITRTGRIQIKGNVLLIIRDGCKYEINGGIELDSSYTQKWNPSYDAFDPIEHPASLTVATESLGDDMGELVATATRAGDAAIGGNVGYANYQWGKIDTQNHDGGTLNIFGGKITAVGCADGELSGVGIGGGFGVRYTFSTPAVIEGYGVTDGGNGCTVNMYNGEVYARAGGNAVGIGGGDGYKIRNDETGVEWVGDGGNGGTFNFYGGIVTSESDLASFGRGLNGERNESAASVAQTAFKIDTKTTKFIHYGASADGATVMQYNGEDIASDFLGSKYVKIVTHTAHKYVNEYVWGEDHSCFAKQVCVLCPEDYEGHIGQTATGNSLDMHHYHGTCQERERTDYTMSFPNPLFPPQTMTVYGTTVPHRDSNGDNKCDWCGIYKSVTYLDKTVNPDGSVTATQKTAPDFPTPVSKAGTVWNSGWYVLDKNTVVGGRITINGDVRLILMDGCTFTAQNGIYVPKSSSFSVYAQSDGNNMGKLSANNTASYAAIGGNNDDSGSISVYGGTIWAYSWMYGAGIGGGEYGSSDVVRIYGGIITATGGGKMSQSKAAGGAGIGGGYKGAGGKVYIYGGTVNAYGTDGGAGIGHGGQAEGGIIEITGGTVRAEGAPALGGDVTIGANVQAYDVSLDETILRVATSFESATKIIVRRKPFESRKEATCSEDGHLEYYKLGGKYYRDWECKNEIPDLPAWLNTPSENGGGKLTVHHNYDYYCHYNYITGIYTAERICTVCGQKDPAAEVYTHECDSSAVIDSISVVEKAYIDTGYHPTDKTRVVMDVYVTSPTEYWFGVWDQDFNRRSYALCNDGKNVYIGYGNDGGGNGGVAVTAGSRHTVELNGNIAYVDGQPLAQLVPSGEFRLDNTLYLFGQNRKGTLFVPNDQKIICYGCRIYEGDEIVHCYIPYMNNGQGGLYDLVEDKFCGNSSSSGYITDKNGIIHFSGTPDGCDHTGHKEYYFYVFSKCYYKDELCQLMIGNGSRSALENWLNTPSENGGGLLKGGNGHQYQYETDTENGAIIETCKNCDHRKTYPLSDFKRDYIDVSGGAYFDTGYRPTGNTRVVMNATINSADEICCYFGAKSSQNAFALSIEEDKISGMLPYVYYGDQIGTEGKLMDLDTKTVELNKNVVWIDGLNRWKKFILVEGKAEDYINYQNFSLGNSLYLFAMNDNGNARLNGGGQIFRFYSCQIYEGDKLVRYFIPSVQNGVAGIFDTIETKFYANASTTGTVTPNPLTGAELIPKNEPTCTQSGVLEYYRYDGRYYKDATCMQEIGNLEAWKITLPENGGGMIPAIGHKDENGDDFCDVCQTFLMPDNTFAGNGTEESPYLIGTLADLEMFRSIVNRGVDFAGVYFKLTADITTALTQSIGVWNDKPFKGIFDGDGHSITFTNTENTGNKGLFGYTVGAKISNLKVYGEIEGNWSLGGIVGCAKDTEITNCENHATITSTGTGDVAYAGGIVGVSEGGCVISGCNNYGNITGNKSVGGIIGEARDNEVIKNCTNNAAVSGVKAVGGIIGNTVHDESKTVLVANCINYGNITVAAGGDNGGGIAGNMAHCGTVKNCFTSGLVSNVGNSGIVIGWANRNFTCENCYYQILDGNAGMMAIKTDNSYLVVQNPTATGVNSHDNVAMIVALNKKAAENDGWYGWYAEDGKVCLKEGIPVHEHTFTFTAQDNTVTAACECGETATTILTVPENPIYDGTEKAASLSDKDDFVSLTGAVVDILYSTDGVDYIKNAPVDAGMYFVKVTVADKEITAQFTIEKANLTVSDFAFAAPEDCAYDGQPKQASVSANKIGMGDITVKYAKWNGTDWDDTTTDAPAESGKYKVYISVDEGTNYMSVPEMLTGDDWVFEIVNVCPHENTNVTYDWNDDHTSCTATKHCNDCNTDILTENATEIKLVEDTHGANCQTMGKGHYEATFATLGTAKTAENGVDTEVGEHHYVDFVCEYCGDELFDDAQNDAKRTIRNAVDHSTDEVVNLLADNAEDAIDGAESVAEVLEIRDITVSQIDAIKAINAAAGNSTDAAITSLVAAAKSFVNSTDTNTVAKVLEIRDYWVAAIEKLEHTYSLDWSYDENYHWHASTCGHIEVVNAFAAHTFDENGKCTVCGYEDTGIRAKVCTVILTSVDEPDTVLYSGTTDGTNICNIGNVANGTYLMSVSCEGAVTRTYTTEITDGKVTQEVALYAEGDVNGDGVIDENDYQQAVNIALSSENAVDTADDLSEDTDYSKAVADFDKDGFVDVIDLALFERKIF